MFLVLWADLGSLFFLKLVFRRAEKPKNKPTAMKSLAFHSQVLEARKENGLFGLGFNPGGSYLT